jgi:hypothetical protein
LDEGGAIGVVSEFVDEVLHVVTLILLSIEATLLIFDFLGSNFFKVIVITAVVINRLKAEANQIGSKKRGSRSPEGKQKEKERKRRVAQVRPDDGSE